MGMERLVMLCYKYITRDNQTMTKSANLITLADSFLLLLYPCLPGCVSFNLSNPERVFLSYLGDSTILVNHPTAPGGWQGDPQVALMNKP